QLHFLHAKETSGISAASIEDVVTGADTQAAVGNTISTISIAAPYESGRFLALFRSKIDTLTLRYRDGDGELHGAIFTMPTGADGLVVLHGTVRGVKAGSEKARKVTTVSGATSVTIHCQFTSPDGNSLLERDVSGKVRFFGGNLRATYDFAKKAAHVAHENFSLPDHKP